MMYLSKGIPARSQNDGFNRVSYCGRVYALGTEMSRLWQQGRYAPAAVPDGKERMITRMADNGLVSVTEEAGALGTYRLLANCVLCPEAERFTDRFLAGTSRRIWTWLQKAGLRLTASELIRLEERGIAPKPVLLGEGGRQQLTETIYTPDTIMDGILETLMEHSPARDGTVSGILTLLKSKRIFLI